MHYNKNRKNSVTSRPLTPALRSRNLAAGVMLCAGLSSGSIHAQVDYLPIQVYFDGNCAKKVGTDQETVDLPGPNGNTKIRWEAVDMAGAPKTGQTFNIYFDPFKGGRPLRGTGSITSQKLDTGIPQEVTYKYTVLGDGCDVKKGLDPYIRVR